METEYDQRLFPALSGFHLRESTTKNGSHGPEGHRMLRYRGLQLQVRMIHVSDCIDLLLIMSLVVLAPIHPFLIHRR